MSPFFNILILLGALQGFIVSGMLFFAKQNKRPNRLLATLILLIAMACFNLYGVYADYWFGSPILRFIFAIVPLVVVMPFGPLIYFYIQSTLDPNFKITKKQRRHFYPVLIDFVPSFTAIFFILGVILNRIKNNPGPWGAFIDDYQVYADIPRWISVTIYVYLSYKYLAAYKAKHPAGLNGQSINFKWVKQLVVTFIIFQSVWLVYLIPYVIPKYSNWMLDTFDWYPIYIPMVILIYWLGIKGYIVQAALKKKTALSSNILSEETIQLTKEALIKAMETDKLFLNPELNVSILAQQIAIPQKTISAVLNQHMEKSFNEFINGYRVAAFKEKIGQPGMEQLTIAGVAAECGFNSQATFQRTFKEITGLSPSAYLKTAEKTGLSPLKNSL
jgi:AraC-like DNA-binding protein